MNNISISDVSLFFQFLDSPREVFCYCLLDKESKNVLPGWGVRFGQLKDVLETLRQVTVDFTLHTTLNSTNLKGRKRADIERARVLCVDLDEGMSNTDIKEITYSYSVQMIVESSPGRFHLYWKVSPLIGLEAWERYQLGLAQYFRGDLNLSQWHHTIRVPGVARVCKDGSTFMPRIVWKLATPAKELTTEDIFSLFPWIEESAKEAKAQAAIRKNAMRSTIKRFQGAIKGGISANNGAVKVKMERILGEKDRNSTLFSLVYGVSSSPVGDDISWSQALSIAHDYNTALYQHEKGPLTEEEVRKTAVSAWERGIAAKDRRRLAEEDRVAKMLGYRAELKGRVL